MHGSDRHRALGVRVVSFTLPGLDHEALTCQGEGEGLPSFQKGISRDRSAAEFCFWVSPDPLTASNMWGGIATAELSLEVRHVAQDLEISGLYEEDSFGDPPRSTVFKLTAGGKQVPASRMPVRFLRDRSKHPQR
jgi:hypothetical protein